MSSLATTLTPLTRTGLKLNGATTTSSPSLVIMVYHLEIMSKDVMNTMISYWRTNSRKKIQRSKAKHSKRASSCSLTPATSNPRVSISNPRAATSRSSLRVVTSLRAISTNNSRLSSHQLTRGTHLSTIRKLLRCQQLSPTVVVKFTLLKLALTRVKKRLHMFSLSRRRSPSNLNMVLVLSGLSLLAIGLTPKWLPARHHRCLTRSPQRRVHNGCNSRTANNLNSKSSHSKSPRTADLHSRGSLRSSRSLSTVVTDYPSNNEKSSMSAILQQKWQQRIGQGQQQQQRHSRTAADYPQEPHLDQQVPTTEDMMVIKETQAFERYRVNVGGLIAQGKKSSRPQTQQALDNLKRK